MKYEVIFNQHDKDEIILRTNELNEAINLTKSFAKKYKMEVYNTQLPSILMCYINMENSEIIRAIGIIEK